MNLSEKIKLLGWYAGYNLKSGFKRIFNLSLNDPKSWDQSLWNLYGSQSLSGEVVTEHSALTFSAVYNAVSLISGTVGSLPLHLYRQEKKSKHFALDESLYHIMHSRWNPYMTAMTGREVMQAHILIYGNGYVEIARDKLGRVQELWPIPPDRVRMKIKGGEIIYEIRVNGENIELPRERILHIPGLGFDGYQGYSVIAMARRSISLGMAMETFGSRYFSEGIHPSGIVTHPHILKDDNLKKALTKAYAGLSNAHRLMLLEEGMQFKQLAINPEDSQFVESRQFTIPEIARWFNLPPHKLKDLTKSSFCLPASEEVFTQYGPQSISEISIGEKVWSLDRTGWNLSPVIMSSFSGIDQIFTIKTTNRTIRCNAKHPLLIRKKSRDQWITKWVPAGQLNKGDTIVTLKSLPDVQSSIPKRQNGDDISVELMEFCGLLMGDGNVMRQNGKPSWVTIARSDHASYMDYYRQIAKKLFTSGGYEYRNGEQHPMSKLTEKDIEEIRKRGKNVLTNMDIARRYSANICSIQNIIHRTYHYESPCAKLNKDQVDEIKELIKIRETTDSIAKDYGVSRDTITKILSGKLWALNRNISTVKPILIREIKNNTRFNSFTGAKELIDLGFSGIARTKRVPGWVFNASNPLKLAFLRGFLDADGSVDKKGRISFSSCNEIMLSQIRHLCMSLNIPVTNLRCQTGTTKLPSGKLKDFKQYCFTCSDPGSNRLIGSHTSEYVFRLNNGKPFNKKDRNYPGYGGKGFDIEGCSLARIVNIDKSIIHEPVYDLTVDQTHSFIANGIVVHNSNIEQEQISFVTDSIMPWLIRLEQSYALQLLTQRQIESGLYFKHSVAGLLRGDSTARSEFYSKMFNIGAFSVNDIRELEDMDPIEGGDEHFVPMNMIPLSMAKEQPKKEGTPPLLPAPTRRNQGEMPKR